MNERIVEILVYLMSEIKEDNGVMEHIDGISQDLKQQGYTDNEINAAFSWLFERIKAETEEIYQSREESQLHSYRVLHDAEKLVITPKAYGYILQLKQLGLINMREVEQIIERAMMLGVSKVDTNDIKAVVVSILFDSEDSDMNFLGRANLDTDGIIH